MTNYKVILQYDGSRYDGWQKQGNTDNTIQGKLESILEKLAGQPVEVHGSGRTDAGVHALGQAANFHLEDGRTAKEVMDYLNRYLPEDIAVTEAKTVPERFHSRLNAVSKTYLYRIETGDKKMVFEQKYIYGLGREMDLGKMRQAAKYLVGEHDFKSFCANKRMKKSTVRRLDSIEITREGSRVYLLFTGNGFLHHMVRIMTGTLIEVGLSERSPESVEELLGAKDRQASGYTAPAEGLFLKNVEY